MSLSPFCELDALWASEVHLDTSGLRQELVTIIQVVRPKT